MTGEWRGIARALALAPLCCRYFARTRLNSECQLLYMLHSTRSKCGWEFWWAHGCSQSADQVRVVERLEAAVIAGVRVLDTVVNLVRFAREGRQRQQERSGRDKRLAVQK